jgi:uncharacterized membrane protein
MPPVPDASASNESLSLRTYLVILVGALLWCGLLVLAPLCAASGCHSPADLLYTFFHRVCHQLGERSLHIAGEPMAVCARCTAIYSGFLAGVVLFPIVRNLQGFRFPRRVLLIAALLPMVADVALNLTGIHESGLLSRLVTGAIAGIVLAFIVLPAAFGAVRQLVARRQPTTTSTTEGLSDA